VRLIPLSKPGAEMAATLEGLACRATAPDENGQFEFPCPGCDGLRLTKKEFCAQCKAALQAGHSGGLWAGMI
jgi:hypothetical protein